MSPAPAPVSLHDFIAGWSDPGVPRNLASSPTSLRPWGMMLEFVSFPNGRKSMENREQLLWSPVNAAA